MNAMPKSRLKAVAPKAAEPSKPKILSFGKPGVGKTWFALQFPEVYFIDVEGGAKRGHYIDLLEKSGGAYMGPEQGATSFEEVLEQVKALAVEQHHYRTLVIDSISKLFALEIAREAERIIDAGKKNEFGADKKPAVAYMRRLVAWLQRIDMNVVLIAHEMPLWGKGDNGERAEIGVTFDAWPKLEYELDLAVNVQKRGPSRIGRVTKSRLLQFPDASNFPWEFAEFADRYGHDVIYADSKSLVLASPEQVAEVTRLLEIVKLPDGQIGKWFDAANVASWEEMDADKIEKCIAALKAKVA